jgi:hypothetical protein
VPRMKKCPSDFSHGRKSRTFLGNRAEGLASCGQCAGGVAFFINDPHRPEWGISRVASEERASFIRFLCGLLSTTECARSFESAFKKCPETETAMEFITTLPSSLCSSQSALLTRDRSSSSVRWNDLQPFNLGLQSSICIDTTHIIQALLSAGSHPRPLARDRILLAIAEVSRLLSLPS